MLCTLNHTLNKQKSDHRERENISGVKGTQRGVETAIRFAHINSHRARSPTARRILRSVGVYPDMILSLILHFLVVW